MQVCSSMTVDDHDVALLEMENNDEAERGQNNDAISVAQRSAHFLFPPISVIASPRRLNDIRDFHPAKRQSFGRKHHWDAFFGRR